MSLPKDVSVDLQEKLKLYRLSPEEYKTIQGLLGRDPEGVEWAVFSALWSEHCSYKSSKVHLKKLFNQSPRVLQSVGENAGIVDLGDGEKVAFKMESHNHPSFIEPYQGAATGVGGILRDIFTMGARPVALANYLCFGEAKANRMADLVDGVVRGIGGYGNCVGVPTVTGQTHFDASYNENILVNAMAVGYFGSEDPVCLSQIREEGNWVVYVGAKTGRDGIHGASMASESFDEESESKRPTVQIGDPFYEKLLIEACLEVMKKGLVVAIQDMGAAGLTSSSFEMAEKGELGVEIDLSKVPLRDPSMTPEDVLLSESQERMLLTCQPGHLEELQSVFKKWGLDACEIGKVIKDSEVRLLWQGEVLTVMDPKMVVSHAPQYERPFDTWTPQYETKKDFPNEPETNEDCQAVENHLLWSVKNWVYDQYDQRVGANTARDCSSPVGVIRLPENSKALGVTLGCRPHLMRQDARFGGWDSVVHPSLQLAAWGFEPLAVTDCLNFGNPEKKETMTQFVGSLEGMNQACESIVAPIISGNVSFYNETQDRNVSPTPSTGLVGLRPNLDELPQGHFTEAGQTIWTCRWGQGWSNAAISEVLGKTAEAYLPLNNEVASFVKSMTNLGRSGLIKSSRVVSQLGLKNTLDKMTTESCGYSVTTDQTAYVEPLYQVVLVTDASVTEESLRKYLGSDVVLESTGSTEAGQIQWNGKGVSCQELKASKQKAWSTHFQELSER